MRFIIYIYIYIYMCVCVFLQMRVRINGSRSTSSRGHAGSRPRVIGYETRLPPERLALESER